MITQTATPAPVKIPFDIALAGSLGKYIVLSHNNRLYVCDPAVLYNRLTALKKEHAPLFEMSANNALK